MPLTARHVDGRHIDSTSDDQWAEVHVASYPGLLCPECRHGMYARKPPHMIRHFAHKAGRPDSCSFATEGPEHLHTKRLVAEAVRTLGWAAEVERPGDGWVADVLATSPSGQLPVAFEVQFASIHESAAHERTRRHRASGIDKTVWLDAKGQESLVALARGRLFYDERDPHVGVQAFEGGRWGPRRLPLATFVQRVCIDRLMHDGKNWADHQDREAEARWARKKEERRAEAERLAEARRELHRKHEENRAARHDREFAESEARAAEQRARMDDMLTRDYENRQREQREQEQERQERERQERERREREAAEQWERERPERERREREAAEHERQRQERAAEWPIERIRALMAATREASGAGPGTGREGSGSAR